MEVFGLLCCDLNWGKGCRYATPLYLEEAPGFYSAFRRHDNIDQFDPPDFLQLCQHRLVWSLRTVKLFSNISIRWKLLDVRSRRCRDRLVSSTCDRELGCVENFWADARRLREVTVDPRDFWSLVQIWKRLLSLTNWTGASWSLRLWEVLPILAHIESLRPSSSIVGFRALYLRL